MGIFDKVLGKKIKVPQANEQSTAVSIAEVEKAIAEDQEIKRSIEHELAAVNIVIASFQQIAQELGDAPSTVREALKEYVTAKESLSDSLDKVNLDLNKLTVDIIPRLDGGREWKQKHFNYCETYLFSWDEIPGNDNGKLVEFLGQMYDTYWVTTANIKKIEDGRTIIVSNEKNSFSLRLNDEKTKVNLKIDDGRTHELNARTENSKLKIYCEAYYPSRKDENENDRVNVIVALGKYYETYSSRKFENENDRVNVIVALVKIGEPAVEPLIRALKDENKDVRTHAIEALVKIGGPAVEPLIRALKDENMNVRVCAAWALGEIGEPAIESLIKAFKDENEDVRKMAVVALGKTRDAQAREYLIQALTDESETFREFAKAALEMIKAEKS